MDGFAIWEEAGQLVMRHAWPVADASGIEMDERREGGWIIANAATLHLQTDFADLGDVGVCEIKIHRLAQHMLRVFGDRLGAAAQHGIGFGRAIGRHNIDRFGRADAALRFPDNIKQARIHAGGLIAAPIAQQPIELFERVTVETAIALIFNGQALARMRVVERNCPRITIGNRVAA